MIYFGQEPSLSLSAKMVITEHELRRLRTGELKGCSYESVGSYVCIYVKKGKKVRIGIYSTIEECNAAYDQCEIEKKIYNLNQRLRSRGYRIWGAGKNKSYAVELEGGFKSYPTKEEARKVYEDIINNQINELEKELHV